MKRIKDDDFTVLMSSFKLRDAVDIIEPLDPLKLDTGYAVVDFDCNNVLTLSDSTEWGKKERWSLNGFMKEMEYVMAQPLTHRAPEVSGKPSGGAKPPLERIGDGEVPLEYRGRVVYAEAKQKLTEGNGSLTRFFDAVPEAMFVLVAFDKQNKTAAVGVSTAEGTIETILGSVNGVTFKALPRNGAHRHLAQLLLPRNIDIDNERTVDTDKYKLRGAGLFKDDNGSWFITRGPSRAVTAAFKRLEGERVSNYITNEEAEILRSILANTVGIDATIITGTKDNESE